MKAFAVAIAVSSLLTAPLCAEEISPAPQAKGEERVPGLQQTPDGQTMKTAGDKIRPTQETQAGPASGPTPSTGPTFPKPPAPK